MVFQASQVEIWETKGTDTSFYFNKLIIRFAELKKPGCTFFINHVSKLTLWIFKSQFSRTCLHDLSEETASCYHMIVMSWHLNIYLVYDVVQNADGGQEAFFYLRTHCADVLCCLRLLQLIQPKTKTRAFRCIPDIAVYKEKKCWEKLELEESSSSSLLLCCKGRWVGRLGS